MIYQKLDLHIHVEVHIEKLLKTLTKQNIDEILGFRGEKWLKSQKSTATDEKKHSMQ